MLQGFVIGWETKIFVLAWSNLQPFVFACFPFPLVGQALKRLPMGVRVHLWVTGLMCNNSAPD